MELPHPAISKNLRNGFRLTAIELICFIYHMAHYILDTETTGTSFKDDELIQLSIIDAQTGDTVFNKYFIPSVPIKEGASKVHGLVVLEDGKLYRRSKVYKNDKEYNYTPVPQGLVTTFEAAYEELVTLLKNKAVMGYNVAFDAIMAETTARHFGLDPLEVGQWIDAMPAFSESHGLWDSQRKRFQYMKLGHFNIESRSAHDALSDCHIVRDFCLKVIDMKSK